MSDYKQFTEDEYRRHLMGKHKIPLFEVEKVLIRLNLKKKSDKRHN